MHTDRLEIIRPDDWHLHLRDGAAMASVCSAIPRAQFARAIVMPNLKPPVTTMAQALAYRERILAAVPAGRDVRAADDAVPHRRHTTPRRSRRAKASGIVYARASSTRPAPPPTRDAGVTDLAHRLSGARGDGASRTCRC